ncbi:MAG: hypothetical protein LBB54_04800, partial [Cellulomonadaceae bacterium]|nr:hypothetical protein [Cellulomonadaceae bacterium]
MPDSTTAPLSIAILVTVPADDPAESGVTGHLAVTVKVTDDPTVASATVNKANGGASTPTCGGINVARPAKTPIPSATSTDATHATRTTATRLIHQHYD